MIVGQGGQDIVDHPNSVAHPLADDHGDGVVIEPLEPVGVNRLLDLVGDGVDQLVVNQVPVQDDGDVVNPGRHVLVRDVVLGQDLQDPQGETGLLVEQVFVEVEGREVLATDDPGDNVARLEVLVGDDQGAGLLGVVGVLDVDWHVPLDGWNQGLVMEDREAGVGELPHLAVGHLADWLGVVDHPRIGRVDGVDVSEVLVQIGVQSPGQDCPGDVRAAPGEGGDMAGQGDAVEARKDQELTLLGRELVQQAVGLGNHAGVVGRPGYPDSRGRRGDEAGLVAQVVENQGHQLGIRPFAMGLEGGQEVVVVRVVSIGQVPQAVEDGGQLLFRQVEVVGDGPVTVADLLEDIIAGLALDHQLGVLDQEVGHLDVTGVPLAGGGGDDHPSLGIIRDNLDCLGETIPVGQGAATKLNYFHLSQTPLGDN